MDSGKKLTTQLCEWCTSTYSLLIAPVKVQNPQRGLARLSRSRKLSSTSALPSLPPPLPRAKLKPPSPESAERGAVDFLSIPIIPPPASTLCAVGTAWHGAA